MSHVSVVVPCFNEEELLPELERRLVNVAENNPAEDIEFILVNDGSSDASKEMLDQMAADNPSFRIIHLAKNCGHQVALAAGLDYASGEEIVIMDADLQDPPELIPAIVETLRKGYDVVHMQRRARKGESWSKLINARLFYWVFRRISDISVVENCGDFRGISRRALTVARNYREPHKFYRATFSHIGFRQFVMPYDRDARFAGETHYPFLKSFKLAVNAVMSFTAAPLNFVFSVAFLMWGICLAYGLHAAYGRFVLQQYIPGWTSLIVLGVFMTGLVLFSIAIVGSYVRRIFEQGQRRPLYWISETRNLDTDEFREFHEQRISGQICEPAVGDDSDEVDPLSWVGIGERKRRGTAAGNGDR